MPPAARRFSPSLVVAPRAFQVSFFPAASAGKSGLGVYVVRLCSFFRFSCRGKLCGVSRRKRTGKRRRRLFCRSSPCLCRIKAAEYKVKTGYHAALRMRGGRRGVHEARKTPLQGERWRDARQSRQAHLPSFYFREDAQRRFCRRRSRDVETN